MASQRSIPTNGRLVRLARLPSRRFPPTAASVAQVRRMVADQLEDVGPSCRDAVVLIASELATNVVRHVRTPYVVELVVGDPIRIEVTDLEPWGRFLRPAHPGAETGRGLLFVSALATRWGVDWRDGCKIVWAEVPVEMNTAD